MIAVHEPELLRCYQLWASSDSRDEYNKLLSCKEAMDMLRSTKLVGRELTIMQVRLALMGALFDVPPRSWQHRMEKMHLVFAEFTELIIRCSEVRFRAFAPSPVERVEAFIGALLGGSPSPSKKRGSV